MRVGPGTLAPLAPLAIVAWMGVAATPVSAAFPVEIERGSRTTAAGDSIAYDLYLPVAVAGQPPPPFPAVILNHGFAPDRGKHALTAFLLAQRGPVVLTPT